MQAERDKKQKFVLGITNRVRALEYCSCVGMDMLEIAMSACIASSTRASHPGLPPEMLFKLFRAAIKDDGDTADSIIQFAYDEIVSFDFERARGAMELVVRRHRLAWSALYALLAEARDAQLSITTLPSEYYEGHVFR